jgi:hypothetical protein
VIKEVEIRAINDAVLATMLKFKYLERCNMWFIENSAQLHLAVKFLKA